MTAPRVHLRHQHEIREQGRASPRSFLSLRRPFSLDQGDRLLMGRAGVEGQIRAFWIAPSWASSSRSAADQPLLDLKTRARRPDLGASN